MSDIEEDVNNKIKRQTESTIKYYKNIDNIEEVPIDILRAMYKDILSEREQDKKRIKELEEYIFIAPNLDEMTASKYVTIQREAYIKGRTEEQQKAEQIIQKNYISKQKVEDKIEELKNENYQIALGSEVALDTGIMKNNLKIKVLEELLQ